MDDYADAVARAASELPQPLSLCGWSMGGLSALQAAERIRPQSVVLIEASPPGEVQGFEPDVELTEGTFDPEAVYGQFPSDARARDESLLARAERKRGISVASLPCPSLVIYGDEFRDERGAIVASFYGSDELEFPALRHWDLVREPVVRKAIAQWLSVA